MNDSRRPEGSARPLLIRFAPLVAVVTLLVVGGAGFYAAAQTPEYTASARVLVEPITLPTATVRPPDMPTEQLVATSAVVLDQAARALNESSATVSSATSVSSPTGTTVLVFDYTAAARAVARQGADAVARAYAAFRDARTAPTKSAVVLPDAPKVSVRIITAASEPGSPSSPDVIVLIGAAVIVGLALGALVAVVAARQDLRVRTALRWQEVTGAPVLATLTRRDLTRDLDPGDVAPDDSGEHRTSVGAGLADELDGARFRIGRLLPARGGVVLVAYSCSPLYATTVGRELAAAFARSGRDSLYLEVQSGRGDDGHRVLVQSGWRPSGRRGLDERTLTGLELAELVRTAGTDQVAVVTVPVAASGALALDLVGSADAVVLVDDVRSTRTRGVERIVRAVETAGATSIGGVLIGLRSRRGPGRASALPRAGVRADRDAAAEDEAPDEPAPVEPLARTTPPVSKPRRERAAVEEREPITTGGKAS